MCFPVETCLTKGFIFIIKALLFSLFYRVDPANIILNMP